MKNFFESSRGEFTATALLLFLILASFAFYFLYEKKAKEQTDFTEFQGKVQDFYAQQQFYADSMAAARAARDSAFARRYAKNRRHSFYKGYKHYYNDSSYPPYRRDTFKLKPFEKKPSYAIQKVDLNHCDTSDIMRVPQFGSRRALKIMEYRAKLGGFHSLSQLHEIYILQNIDTVFCEKYFFVHARDIKKIHINSASYKEMISHPYFDAYLTKTILRYREQNGKIRNPREFQEITHAYTDLMEKLTPYLAFD